MLMVIFSTWGPSIGGWLGWNMERWGRFGCGEFKIGWGMSMNFGRRHNYSCEPRAAWERGWKEEELRGRLHYGKGWGVPRHFILGVSMCALPAESTHGSARLVWNAIVHGRIIVKGIEWIGGWLSPQQREMWPSTCLIGRWLRRRWWRFGGKRGATPLLDRSWSYLWPRRWFWRATATRKISGHERRWCEPPSHFFNRDFFSMLWVRGEDY